jgi:hypothetical protein
MRGKAWSPAEDRQLTKLISQGMRNKEIARVLTRSPQSVGTRAFYLKLTREVMDDPVDITIRLPSSLFRKLEREAKRLGVSKGHLYRTILEKELNDVSASDR